MRIPPALAVPILVAALIPRAGAAPRSEEPPAIAQTPEVAFTPRAVRIELDLTLDPANGTLHERAAVTVDGKGPATLVFALDEGLSVEAVTASEGVAEHRKAGTEVRVEIDPPLDGPRTLRFRISGTPKRGGRPLVRPTGAVLDSFDGFYPRFVDTWASTSVTVRVPAGWTAVAPGRRIAGKDGVWTWKADAPIRSLALGAAPGLEIATIQVLRIPLTLAAPANGPRAAAIEAPMREAIAWLAGALAPYPFEALNVVVLPGIVDRAQGGGIIVVPAGTPLAGAADAADLVAGQWFGERVSGDGPWIRAFAAWQATVFARDRAIPLPASIVRLREEYFRLRSGDVPLARADAGTPEAVIRGKGSAVPDMIRLAVDEREFFGAMRDLFAAPVGPALSIDAIRAALEARTKRPLGRVFDDWFRRAGAPEIQAEIRTFPAATGGFRVDLTLRQTRGTYALPVEIVLYGPGREHRETVDIEGETTSPFWVLDFEPLRVEVDPSRRLFRW